MARGTPLDSDGMRVLFVQDALPVLPIGRLLYVASCVVFAIAPTGYTCLTCSGSPRERRLCTCTTFAGALPSARFAIHQQSQIIKLPFPSHSHLSRHSSRPEQPPDGTRA